MIKSVVLALAAATATLAAGTAHAGGISWSIGINTPIVGTVISNGPGYVQGYAPGYESGYAPVYRSEPVYADPYYAEPYYAPAPVYRYAPPSYVSVPVPVYRAVPVPARGYYRPHDGHYRPAPVLHPREPHRGWRDGNRHGGHRDRHYD